MARAKSSLYIQRNHGFVPNYGRYCLGSDRFVAYFIRCENSFLPHSQKPLKHLLLWSLGAQVPRRTNLFEIRFIKKKISTSPHTKRPFSSFVSQVECSLFNPFSLTSSEVSLAIAGGENAFRTDSAHRFFAFFHHPLSLEELQSGSGMVCRMIDGRPEVSRTCFLYSQKRSDPTGAEMIGPSEGLFIR